LLSEDFSAYFESNERNLEGKPAEGLVTSYIGSKVSAIIDDKSAPARSKVYNARRVKEALADYPELNKTVYDGWLSPEKTTAVKELMERKDNEMLQKVEELAIKDSKLNQAEKDRDVVEEKRKAAWDKVEEERKAKETAEKKLEALSNDPEYRKIKDTFGNYAKAIKSLEERRDELEQHRKQQVEGAEVLKAREEKLKAEEEELKRTSESYRKVRNNFEDEKEKYMASLIDLGQKEGDLSKRERELGQKDAEYKALFSEKARIETGAKALVSVEAKQVEEWEKLNKEKGEHAAEKAKLTEQAKEVMRLRGEAEAQYAQLEGLAAEFGKLPDPTAESTKLLKYLTGAGKRQEKEPLYRDWEGGYVMVDGKHGDMQEDAWGLAEMLLGRTMTKEAEEAKYSFRDFATAEKKTAPNDASSIITSIENYFREIKDAEAEFDRNNCANACDNLTWAFKLEKDIRTDILAYYELKKKEEEEKRKKSNAQADAMRGVADKLGIK